MKRKRGNVKPKPKKTIVVGASEAFSSIIYQNADHYGLDDFDNAEFDPGIEAETLQTKSCEEAGLEKQVVNERMEDSGNSLPISGNLSKKAVSTKTKSSRDFGSSSNPSSNPVPVESKRTCQEESRLPYLDPRYKEQELNVALLVIKKIMKMDAAQPFNVPVNPIALGIPDYFTVINTPMDFGTICNNLENGLKYLNSEIVFKDVQLIWENCCKYNKKGDYILELMKRVKKNFIRYWTAAGLYKEPQANSGNSHLSPPIESTMRCSEHGHMCSFGPMTDDHYHQMQDLTGPSQVQHHQFSPSYIDANQPHHRTCLCCQSSFREQPVSWPQAGINVGSADSTMRRNQCRHMCSVDPINGNISNQQPCEMSPSQAQHRQPLCSYKFLYHPQQISCQCHSISRQQQSSQLQAGINTCDAGHVHLPLHTDPTTKCSKCRVGSQAIPMTGNDSHQQQYPVGLNQIQAHQPSPSYNQTLHLHQRTCQCHSISSQSQLSHPEDITDIGSAGHSRNPMESTLKHSKCRQEVPVGPLSNKPGHQQQNKMGPSQVQSNEPSLIKSHTYQPEQSPRPCQISSCQPQPSVPQAGVNTDSTGVKRRGRGPARCLKLFREGKRISIATNELGQPIGLEAPKLNSFLGILARNGHLSPLTYVDWRAMPDANKENMWQQVQSKFDIDSKCKNWVLKSLGKKWKDWKSKLKIAHYNTHVTDEERLADRDERVLPDQWSILISHWNSEKVEKRSAINKANRARNKFNHTTGTKSFARVRQEQRVKKPKGKAPSRAELFILTHTRKDGQPVNEASSAVISQLRELATQQPETSENSTIGDDIFSQVMGQDRHGRVRTYGLGPSPSDLGGPKPNRVEAMRMVSEANAEVREMKERMVTMEQTCTQMAAQMATMMSMISSMHRTSADKHLSEGSRPAVTSYETRARKRGKMQNTS